MAAISISFTSVLRTHRSAALRGGLGFSIRCLATAAPAAAQPSPTQFVPTPFKLRQTRPLFKESSGKWYPPELSRLKLAKRRKAIMLQAAKEYEETGKIKGFGLSSMQGINSRLGVTVCVAWQA